MASEHPNPFKNFIEKNKLPEVLTLNSMDPFNGNLENYEIISPLENSYEAGDLAKLTSNLLENPDDANNWVQYMDDETGYLYWYNTVTGESRWLTEDEMQQQTENNQTYEQETFQNGETIEVADELQQPEQNVQPTEMVTEVLTGPWEKYYDDDGNPFYYNKETGASEWEIPADQLQYVTYPLTGSYDSNDAGYESIEVTEIRENSGSVKEKPTPRSNKSPGIRHTGSSMKQASFRSVRSARSLGLLVPPPINTSTTLKAEVSFDPEDSMNTSQSKKLKSRLSFSLKKVPSVNNNLKPTTPSPLKRKSKNGFQMLKEGARVLQHGKDELGQTWVEYQTADDGPIFYSIEGADGGQWNRPNVFEPIREVQRGGDDGSSVGDHDVEVIDNLSEGLLTIKTPIKTEKSKSTSSKNNSSVTLTQLTVNNTSSNKAINNNLGSAVTGSSNVNKSSDDVETVDPVKLLSKSYVNLGINSIMRTASTQNLKSPTKEVKEVLKDPVVQTEAKIVLDTFTNPNTATNLKIKNIQAEAMAELQKLREKLNQAKKNFAASPAPTLSQLPAGGISPVPVASTPTTIPNTTPSKSLNIEAKAELKSGSQPETSKPNEKKETVTNPPKVTNPDLLEEREKVKASDENQRAMTAYLESSQASTTSTLSQSGTNPASQLHRSLTDKSENITPFQTHRTDPEKKGEGNIVAGNDEEKSTARKVQEPIKEASKQESPKTNEVQISKPGIAENTKQTIQKDVPPSTIVKKTLPSLMKPEPTPVQTPVELAPRKEIVESKDEKPVADRKTVLINNESYYWDEISARAHIIQKSSDWLCLYDTKLKIRFFKRKEDGECQFDKPADFDTNIELLTASTPAPTATSSATSMIPSSTPISQAKPPLQTKFISEQPQTKPQPQSQPQPQPQPSQVKPDAQLKGTLQILSDNKPTSEKKVVSVVPAIIPTNTTPQKPLVKPRSEFDTFFTDLDTIEKNPTQIQQHPEQTETNNDTFPAVEIYDYLNRLKNSSGEDDYKTKESEQFLRRLQVLTSSSGFGENESANAKKKKSSVKGIYDTPNFRYTKHVNDMDKDELRKVQHQCQHLLERCCDVLEQMEKSPIEHAFNEKILIQLALQQRAQLSRSKDLRHDGFALGFSSKEFTFPCSRLLKYKIETIIKPIQIVNSAWVLARIHLPTSHHVHKYVYYNKIKKVFQFSEPFDSVCKKSLTNLRREKWSDYEIYTGIRQDILEKEGIELYSDSYEGYLFYCPQRKLFSSNGLFDHDLASSATTSSSSPKKKSKVKSLKKFSSLTATSKGPAPSNVLDDSQFYPNFWANLSWRDHLISGLAVQEQLEEEKKIITSTTSKARKNREILTQEKNELDGKFRYCLDNLPSKSSNSIIDPIKSSKYKRSIETFSDENEKSQLDNLRLLSFESHLDKNSYQQYHNYMLNLANDPENPLNYLKVVELLLYQGQGKASLAILKQAIDVMKSSVHFSSFHFHDSYSYYLLSLKLSQKYFNHYERYDSILQLSNSFAASLSSSQGSSAAAASNHSLLAFLCTHIAIYFIKLRQYQWAEIYLLDALLYTPHGTLPQLQYAFLLYEKSTELAPSDSQKSLVQDSLRLSNSMFSMMNTNSGEYKLIKKYLLRATQNPAIMGATINDSAPFPLSSSSSASYLNLQFSSTFSRIAKLQLAWLTELYECESKSERENLPMDYKQCLVHQAESAVSNQPLPTDYLELNFPGSNSNKTDHIQSLAYHSLGKYYQIEKGQYNTAIEYYQKAMECDHDNYIPYLLYSTLSLSIRRNKELNNMMSWILPSSPSIVPGTINFDQNQQKDQLLFIPSPKKKKTIRKSGELQALDLSSALVMNSEQVLNSERRSSRPSSARLGGEAVPSANTASKKLVELDLTMKKVRPKSAGSTRSNGIASTPILPSMISHIPSESPLYSNSQKILPATKIIEIRPESSYNITSRPKSPLSTTSATNGLSSSLSSLSLLNQLQIDAFYRKCILLIDNCSYRWILLLMYGDYLCYQIGDLIRAREYYHESMKVSFSTNIWSSLAYIYYLQYVVNDYASIPMIFTQMIKLYYPFSISNFIKGKPDLQSTSKLKYSFFRLFLLYLTERNKHLQATRTQHQLQQKLFSTNSRYSEEENNRENNAIYQQKNYQGNIYEEINPGERLKHTILFLAIAHYFFTVKELSLCKQFLMESYRYTPTYLPTLRFIAIIHYYEEDITSANEFISTVYHQYVNTLSQNSFHYPVLLKTMALFQTKKYSIHNAITLLEKSFTGLNNNASSSSMAGLRGECFLSFRLLGILYTFQFYSSVSPPQTSPNYSTWKNARQQYQEKALQSFSTAYQLSENIDIESLRLQAQILMNQHQFLEAKVYLLDILQQKNNDIISIVNLAVCMYYIYYHPQRGSLSSSSSSSSSLFYSSEQQYQKEKNEIKSMINEKEEGKGLSENIAMKLEMIYHSKNFYHVFFVAIAKLEQQIHHNKEEMKRRKATTGPAAAFASPEKKKKEEENDSNDDKEKIEDIENTDDQYHQLISLLCYTYFWFGFIENQQLSSYLAKKQLQDQEMQEREYQMNQLHGGGHGYSDTAKILAGGNAIDMINLIERDSIMKQLYINALDCFQKAVEMGNQWSYVPSIHQLSSSQLPSPITYHQYSSQQDYIDRVYYQNYFSHYNTLLPLAYYYLGKLNEEISQGSGGSRGIVSGEVDYSKCEEIYMKCLDYGSMNPFTLLQLIQMIEERIKEVKQAFQIMKKEQIQLMKQHEYKDPTSAALLGLEEETGDEDDSEVEGGKKKKIGKKKGKKKVKRSKKKSKESTIPRVANMTATSDYEIDDLNYFAPKRTGLYPGDPGSLQSHQQYFAASLADYDSKRLQQLQEEEEEDGESRRQDESKSFFKTLFDVDDYASKNSKQKQVNKMPFGESVDPEHTGGAVEEMTMKELLARSESVPFSSSSSYAQGGVNHNYTTGKMSQKPPLAHQYLNLSLQQSMNQSMLMKRLLMYQRVLDHLLLKKQSYEKLYDDLIFPRFGMSADEKGRKKHAISPSASSSSSSSVSKAFSHPISFIYLSGDWIDEYFFSFSKCEDWNDLYQATETL